MNFKVRELIKKEFVQNILTLVSASTISQAIAFLVYFILIRIYSPAEHGLLALYLSIISVTGIMATGKYDLAIMMPRSRTHAGALTLLTISIGLGFSLLLLIITIVFAHPIARFLGNPDIRPWLYLVPLSTFLTSCSQAFLTWSNRRKKFRVIAGSNLGQSLINSTVKLASFRLIPGGGGLVAGAIAGQISSIVIYFSNLRKGDLTILRAIRRKNMREVARRYRLFPRYNLPHYVINNFSTALPVFLFSSAFNATQVGLYSLGMMMINRPLNILTSSFTQVFSQRVIANYNKGFLISKEVKRLVGRLFLISLLPFILTGVFAPAGFRIIGGDDWFQAGIYMRYLLPWFFLVFLSSPLSFLPDMLKRQRKAMWIDIIKFVLRLIALYTGIKMNNIDLAILLFSGISGLLVAYNLYWYLNLSAAADRIRGQKR